MIKPEIIEPVALPLVRFIFLFFTADVPQFIRIIIKWNRNRNCYLYSFNFVEEFEHFTLQKFWYYISFVVVICDVCFKGVFFFRGISCLHLNVSERYRRIVLILCWRTFSTRIELNKNFQHGTCIVIMLWLPIQDSAVTRNFFWGCKTFLNVPKLNN